MEVTTFGGGCFWCIEAIFQEVRGVQSVVSGYCGGEVEDPTYEQVSSGLTGHAEVVRVHFDTEVISYRDVLRLFFAIHDPTKVNRQGGNVGPQYRSIIFFHSVEQKRIANEVLAEVAQFWSEPVVTQLEELKKFYLAEDHLQNFFKNNPEQSYCKVIIQPKMQRFRELFFQYTSPSPTD
jgi:peptide-methionine (S)-S-oxide reductase